MRTDHRARVDDHAVLDLGRRMHGWRPAPHLRCRTASAGAARPEKACRDTTTKSRNGCAVHSTVTAGRRRSAKCSVVRQTPARVAASRSQIFGVVQEHQIGGARPVERRDAGDNEIEPRAVARRRRRSDPRSRERSARRWLQEERFHASATIFDGGTAVKGRMAR